MTDFYQNKFVIKIESGHPGYRVYTVIATRENMVRMVQELSQAIAQSAERQSPPPQESDGISKLWTEFATVAFGETSRVYLSFALAPDLDAFHVRPKRSRDLSFYFGCLGVFVVLTLAVIGIKALIQGFIP